MSTTSRPGDGGYYGQTQVHTNQGHTYEFLKLSWTEDGVTLEYNLRYNLTRPGFWISSIPQQSNVVLKLRLKLTNTFQYRRIVARTVI